MMRMTLRRGALLVGLLVGGCATGPSASVLDRQVVYGYDGPCIVAASQARAISTTTGEPRPASGRAMSGAADPGLWGLLSPHQRRCASNDGQRAEHAVRCLRQEAFARCPHGLVRPHRSCAVHDAGAPHSSSNFGLHRVRGCQWTPTRLRWLSS